MRYAVFTEWKVGARFEDIGAFFEASSPEEALEMCHRRGDTWGLGFRPDYVGAVARAIPGRLDRDKHPLLWSHFVQGTAWSDGGVEYGEWVGRASDDVVVGLGLVCSEDQVERYLRAHPTPDTW